MVAVFKRDETTTLYITAVEMGVEAHLQGNFHCRRAIVRIKDTGQARRCDLQQGLGQLHRRFVREAGEDDVFELLRLVADRGGNAWLAMAEKIGPPRTDRIQVASAVHAFQPGTATTADGQQRQRIGMLGHLRAGMPQHGQVARPKLGCLC